MIWTPKITWEMKCDAANSLKLCVSRGIFKHGTSSVRKWPLLYSPIVIQMEITSVKFLFNYFHLHSINMKQNRQFRIRRSCTCNGLISLADAKSMSFLFVHLHNNVWKRQLLLTLECHVIPYWYSSSKQDQSFKELIGHKREKTFSTLEDRSKEILTLSSSLVLFLHCPHLLQCSLSWRRR